MTIRLFATIIAMFAILYVPHSSGAEEDPAKALCPVCAVHGETDLEKVKAKTIYEGKPYYFCSDHCKEQFDVDPLSYIPQALPRPAPTFVVEALDGSDERSQFEDRITIIDFWATWCKPCEKIMGIAIDEGDDRVKKIEKYLKKHGISYPVFSDAKNAPAWYAYRVRAVPALFLVDQKGQVVAEWRGSVDHDALNREVARLMAD
jgi:YHS domain-containing protein